MKIEDDIEKYRTLVINRPQITKFVSNSIVTAKYNFFTFLPIFLFNEFRKYNNIFFLTISVIQQLPGVSPMGKYTTLIPLIIILIVTALKELFEDISRHQDDKKINARPIEVWSNTKGWIELQWKHINVGEIVRVKNNSEFPADLIFICSSESTSNMAYVETVNLDGENNLKIRRVPLSLNVNEADLSDLQGTIICDQPNEVIYSFNGVIILKNHLKISINEEQILLRGAMLRNTEWVIGIVVYSGNDTKIWQNSQQKQMKRSKSMDIINWHMMVLFTVVFILMISNSILYIIWNYQFQKDLWYLPLAKDKNLNIFTFLTFIVGYSYIIPISIQIYLEIVRLFQAYFINIDEKMRDENSGAFAKAKTSNLNSDLGEVKYIFTDKTGTLTQNILELKKCSINGIMYEMSHLLMSKSKVNSACHHFFIAICVAPGIISVYDKLQKEWKYYSSSTDQLALIVAAKKYGYELRKRSYKTAEIYVRGTLMKYQILSDIDFTNERRRSSTVVCSPENKIYLYVIGADDTIFKRLSSKSLYQRETSDHINKFALSGLRTLCIAMVELSQGQFVKWNKIFTKAKLEVTSRQVIIGEVAETIEKNLSLLGAVACEDKLQDQVPETISILIEAGIKLWMLTGDKQETATNIAYSTKLLSVDSTIFILTSENIQELYSACIHISHQMRTARQPALIISGNSMSILLKSNYAEFFTTLSMNCESVICFRMIPIQKAQIVKYIQNRTNKVTLAIGDGANDVAMIQSASVGIGISGVEGLQAVYAADYSISVFKHLRRLLLVHGTWNYDRVCKIIFYIYYKNLPIGLIVFYFSFISGWSGSSIFDDWAFTLYNVAFTDGATLVIGIFEKYYPEKILNSDPTIYKRNNWFNVSTFYLCLFNGILHSILILFFTLNLCGKNVLWKDGYNDNYIIDGNLLYTNMLTVVIAKCMLHMMNKTKIVFLLTLSTAILWLPVLIIYNYFWNIFSLDSDLAGTTLMLFSTPVFWLNIILVPFSVLLIDFLVILLYRTFFFTKK